MEIKHQNILNVARAITFHSNILFNLWNFSIQHVVPLINRIPSHLLKSKCPYEILFKAFPILIHLKIFVHFFPQHSKPVELCLRLKLEKAIFLGFKDSTKGYILYDL